MIGICLDVLFGVVNRFIFKFSVSWTEELARFLMIWICMLGASIALKEGGHIGVTFFLMKLRKLKTTVITINYLLILIFVGTVTIWGFKLCISQSYQLSPSLRFSIPLSLHSFIFSSFQFPSSLFPSTSCPVFELAGT